MGKIELINRSIKNGVNEVSKLSNEVMGIGGYTSNKIRHLLNNLGSGVERIFEIGSHRGATFCATTFQNVNILNAGFCDNFSELDDGTVRSELIANARVYSPSPMQLVFYEKDCFTIQTPDLKKIDLFIYDGNHSYYSQKNALVYFKECMNEEFIFICDDFSWQQPKTGTYHGIKEAGLDIIYEQVLWDGKEGGEWWNGIGVFLLKKNK